MVWLPKNIFGNSAAPAPPLLPQYNHVMIHGARAGDVGAAPIDAKGIAKQTQKLQKFKASNAAKNQADVLALRQARDEVRNLPMHPAVAALQVPGDPRAILLKPGQDLDDHLCRQAQLIKDYENMPIDPKDRAEFKIAQEIFRQGGDKTRARMAYCKMMGVKGPAFDEMEKGFKRMGNWFAYRNFPGIAMGAASSAYLIYKLTTLTQPETLYEMVDNKEVLTEAALHYFTQIRDMYIAYAAGTIGGSAAGALSNAAMALHITPAQDLGADVAPFIGPELSLPTYERCKINMEQARAALNKKLETYTESRMEELYLTNRPYFHTVVGEVKRAFLDKEKAELEFAGRCELNGVYQEGFMRQCALATAKVAVILTAGKLGSYLANDARVGAYIVLLGALGQMYGQTVLAPADKVDEQWKMIDVKIMMADADDDKSLKAGMHSRLQKGTSMTVGLVTAQAKAYEQQMAKILGLESGTECGHMLDCAAKLGVDGIVDLPREMSNLRYALGAEFAARSGPLPAAFYGALTPADRARVKLMLPAAGAPGLVDIVNTWKKDDQASFFKSLETVNTKFGTPAGAPNATVDKKKKAELQKLLMERDIRKQDVKFVTERKFDLPTDETKLLLRDLLHRTRKFSFATAEFRKGFLPPEFRRGFWQDGNRRQKLADEWIATASAQVGDTFQFGFGGSMGTVMSNSLIATAGAVAKVAYAHSDPHYQAPVLALRLASVAAALLPMAVNGTAAYHISDGRRDEYEGNKLTKMLWFGIFSSGTGPFAKAAIQSGKLDDRDIVRNDIKDGRFTNVGWSNIVNLKYQGRLCSFAFPAMFRMLTAAKSAHGAKKAYIASRAMNHEAKLLIRLLMNMEATMGLQDQLRRMDVDLAGLRLSNEEVVEYLEVEGKDVRALTDALDGRIDSLNVDLGGRITEIADNHDALDDHLQGVFRTIRDTTDGLQVQIGGLESDASSAARAASELRADHDGLAGLVTDTTADLKADLTGLGDRITEVQVGQDGLEDQVAERFKSDRAEVIENGQRVRGRLERLDDGAGSLAGRVDYLENLMLHSRIDTRGPDGSDPTDPDADSLRLLAQRQLSASVRIGSPRLSAASERLSQLGMALETTNARPLGFAQLRDQLQNLERVVMDMRRDAPSLRELNERLSRYGARIAVLEANLQGEPAGAGAQPRTPLGSPTRPSAGDNDMRIMRAQVPPPPPATQEMMRAMLDRDQVSEPVSFDEARLQGERLSEAGSRLSHVLENLRKEPAISDDVIGTLERARSGLGFMSEHLKLSRGTALSSPQAMSEIFGFVSSVQSELLKTSSDIDNVELAGDLADIANLGFNMDFSVDPLAGPAPGGAPRPPRDSQTAGSESGSAARVEDVTDRESDAGADTAVARSAQS
jgi:hypothetical protein